MRDQPGFDDFWFELICALWPPQCVSAWSFEKGYTGSWFSARCIDTEILCISPDMRETRVSKSETEEYWELWLCISNVDAADVKKMSVGELHAALRELCVSAGDEDKSEFIISLFRRFL